MALDYYTYNDIIFEHFFNPHRSDQATMLAFDPEEARIVGESVGEKGDTFAAGVMQSVRDLYRGRGGFGWWRDRLPRERAGLLACSVLTMASLSIEDERGFYSHYYRDVLNSDMAKGSQEFGVQSMWWDELQTYLNETRQGELGRLVFLEVVKLTHLNYPASQSILRGVDRLWLWEFFSRWIADPSITLTRARFLATWKPGAVAEPVGIRRMGAKLIGEDESASLIWEIFAGEFEAWRLDPVQQEKIARRRLRRDGRPSALRREAIALSESSRLDDDLVGVNYGRTRYSLYRPLLPAGLPYTLRMEALLPTDVESGFPELDDGWVRLPEQTVNASQFLAGYTVKLNNISFRVRSSEIACFPDDSSGLRSVDTFPVGKRITLLFNELSEADYADFFDECLLERADLLLDGRLAGLRAISGTLDAAVSEEDLPDNLRQLFVRPNFDLGFRLGLRLRDGRYLQGAPPMVHFIHPARTTAPLRIDNQDAGLVRRGLTELPADLPPGLRTISVLDRERTFRIAFPDEVEAQSYDLHDNEGGFLVRARPPLIRSSFTACSIRTSELEGMNAVVVQGADVLLPYTRTS